ncbi:MAG: hypothetical protein LBH76_06395, partial [Propionibacteriaceae bacterium]|nr:hypothetical protein [Propionibacteriaceae bacterium]
MADETGPDRAAPEAGGVAVAQVYVDVGLPHLDRPFDYAVPAPWAETVRPGVRVKVRFAGRLADGWVVGTAASSAVAKLSPLSRVVSPEAVLPPASARLIRAVADHMGGTFCDVARLAVPPRHAATEKAAPPPAEASPAREVSGAEAVAGDGLEGSPAGAGGPDTPVRDAGSALASGLDAPVRDAGSTLAGGADAPDRDVGSALASGLDAPVRDAGSALAQEPAGHSYLAALRGGGSPRAAWTATPVAGPAGDWADVFAAAAAAAVASGRSAVLIAPDGKDCARLLAAVGRRVDPRQVVEQRADLGPAARYRGFLRALRGQARVVVGSRAAAYTPVA